MEDQRERARAARGEGDDLGWEDDAFSALSEDVTTEFVGYDSVTESAEVLAISCDNLLVDKASEGDEIRIILNRTPFYAEGGGQVGDRGEMTVGSCQISITDTKKDQMVR